MNGMLDGYRLRALPLLAFRDSPAPAPGPNPSSLLFFGVSGVSGVSFFFVLVRNRSSNVGGWSAYWWLVRLCSCARSGKKLQISVGTRATVFVAAAMAAGKSTRLRWLFSPLSLWLSYLGFVTTGLAITFEPVSPPRIYFRVFFFKCLVSLFLCLGLPRGCHVADAFYFGCRAIVALLVRKTRPDEGGRRRLSLNHERRSNRKE